MKFSVCFFVEQEMSHFDGFSLIFFSFVDATIFDLDRKIFSVKLNVSFENDVV